MSVSVPSRRGLHGPGTFIFDFLRTRTAVAPQSEPWQLAATTMLPKPCYIFASDADARGVPSRWWGKCMLDVGWWVSVLRSLCSRS